MIATCPRSVGLAFELFFLRHSLNETIALMFITAAKAPVYNISKAHRFISLESKVITRVMTGASAGLALCVSYFEKCLTPAQHDTVDYGSSRSGCLFPLGVMFSDSNGIGIWLLKDRSQTTNSMNSGRPCTLWCIAPRQVLFLEDSWCLQKSFSEYH